MCVCVTASVCMYCARSMRIYIDAHLYAQPRFPSLQFHCSAGFALNHLAVARGAEHDEPILRSRNLQTLKHQESRYYPRLGYLAMHALRPLQVKPRVTPSNRAKHLGLDVLG